MSGANTQSRIMFTVPCKDILGLRSNIENFRWSFGQNVPNTSLGEYEDCSLKISLFLQDDGFFEEDKYNCNSLTWGKYHYFSGEASGSLVFYQRPLFLGSEIYLRALNLDSNEPIIQLNRNYLQFVHFRFMNLHSINFILTDIVACLLLARQLSPIHCSAFRINGQTVVVFAPSNTGKTLTTMQACLEQGAEFISEDIAITDGNQIFGLPWTSTFRFYDKVDNRLNARLLNHLKSALPFLELFPLVRNKAITEFISADRICHQADITHVVMLERGKTYVGRESQDVALKKISNLNRAEFNYQRSLVNNAYEYFNPQLDIAGAAKTESQILQRLVSDGDKCFVVRAEDPSEYTNLIFQQLLNID